QAPRIGDRTIERDAIVVMGQDLAEARHANRPRTGLPQLFLERRTDTEFGHLPRPALPARTALVSESTRVFALVAADVAEPRNVEAGRAAAVHDAIGEPVDAALGPDAEVVIHDVVTELARAAPESVRPDVSGRVHEDPRRVEGRRAEEHDARVELLGQPRFGIDDLDTWRALPVAVVHHARDDRVGTERQVAGGTRGRQGCRLRAEIRTERTAR